MPLFLNGDEVRRHLSAPDCIAAMERILIALAGGHVHQPQRTFVRPPDASGFLGLMPSYLAGEGSSFAVKAVCVFPGNVAIGKDAHQGAVLLFSGQTGELRAVMDAAAITAIRTGAVSGVATRLLARPDAGDLALIGAGVQARTHLAALASVRKLRRVKIVGRTSQRAALLAAEVRALYPFPIEVAETVEEAVRGADLIVTATSSKEAVLHRSWISPGTHLNVVGSFVPTSREVDTATMADASLFVDRREAVLAEAGDYVIAAREGAIGPGHIRAELGELLTHARPGRTSAEEITIFKSVGMAAEDLGAALHLYERAKRDRFGIWVGD